MWVKWFPWVQSNLIWDLIKLMWLHCKDISSGWLVLHMGFPLPWNCTGISTAMLSNHMGNKMTSEYKFRISQHRDFRIFYCETSYRMLNQASDSSQILHRTKRYVNVLEHAMDVCMAWYQLPSCCFIIRKDARSWELVEPRMDDIWA